MIRTGLDKETAKIEKTDFTELEGSRQKGTYWNVMRFFKLQI